MSPGCSFLEWERSVADSMSGNIQGGLFPRSFLSFLSGPPLLEYELANCDWGKFLF